MPRGEWGDSDNPIIGGQTGNVALRGIPISAPSRTDSLQQKDYSPMSSLRVLSSLVGLLSLLILHQIPVLQRMDWRNSLKFL